MSPWGLPWVGRGKGRRGHGVRCSVAGELGGLAWSSPGHLGPHSGIRLTRSGDPRAPACPGSPACASSRVWMRAQPHARDMSVAGRWQRPRRWI